MPSAPASGAQLIRGSLATLLGLTATTIGLTWLFLGMRAVMDIGGSCASGGPYEIANPCPEGVPLVIVGGIFGGLAGLFGYGIFGLQAGPRLVLLAWPALFLSLGWNFLDYGLRPPGQEGVDPSLLVVAVLFLAMGGLPLLALLNRRTLRAAFWADPWPATPPVVTVPPASPPARTRLKAWSALLHLLAIAAGLWLGAITFDWLTS